MACVLVGRLNKWPPEWQVQQLGQLQITSFCISPGFMAIGRKGGKVEMFARDFQEQLMERWSQILLDDSVQEMSISEDENLLAIGAKTSGKILTVDTRSGVERVRVGLGEGVVQLVWSKGKLFVGGAAGTVAVIQETAIKQVLSLDSRIVQLTVSGEVLVASTLTRAVLCNTMSKTFREVGSKLRQGEQGVVVVGRRVWAARPGCRLWEVETEGGTVLATRQYKKALNEIPPTLIHNLQTNKNVEEIGEHCFLSLVSDGNGIVVSHSSDGKLYLLDMDNSGVLAWTNTGKATLAKMVVADKTVILLRESGVIMSVSFGPLQDMLTNTYSLQKHDLCAEILLRNRKYLRSMTPEARTKVLSLKPITNSIMDPDRSAKLMQVFEILSDWNGKEGEMNRRRVSSGPHASLAQIYNGYWDNRSVSQERNRSGQRGSSEGTLHDDAVSGKCHSQEDLLVTSRRKSPGHLNRSLSGSRRNMSASEQGLQALKLYNIKCGGTARSLQQSPLTSRNVSAERLEQEGWPSRMGSRKMEEDQGGWNSSKLEEQQGRWRNGKMGENWRSRKGSEGSESIERQDGQWSTRKKSEDTDSSSRNVSIERLEHISRNVSIDGLEYSSRNVSKERLEYLSRNVSMEMVENSSRNVPTERLVKVTAEVGDELRERLEEQARQAGLDIDMTKVVSGAVNASSIQSVGSLELQESLDDEELLERQESRFPLSEWEFGSCEGGLYGAEVIGSSITAGVDKLIETGARIASESKLAELVSSIRDLESPRLGMSGRLDKELRNTIRIKKIEEIALVAKRINESTNNDALVHIKTLSTLIIEEYFEQTRNLNNKDSSSSSEDSDSLQIPSCLCLSRHLNQEQIQQIQKSFEIIFSSDVNREIFFRPMRELALNGVSEQISLVSMKLLMAFEQKYLDFDALISTVLILVSDLVDTQFILPHLTECDFNTYKFLMSLEESKNPDLSPIRLEQIDERNVFECSNFLSGYTSLTYMSTLRFLEYIVKLNAECAVHLVQSFSLKLSTQEIMFVAFSYYEAMMNAISYDLEVSVDLQEAVNKEFSTFLAKMLSCHIGGHVAKWTTVFNRHPNLTGFLTDVFMAANEANLSKTATMAGSHRCQRGLEIAPLGEFIIKLLGLEDSDSLEFCKKTFFMSGFVRSILQEPSRATGEIPLLVELGDPGLLVEVGLLESHTASLLVDHLLAVYGPDQQGQCPIQWPDLGELMLERAGPSVTLELLKSAAHVMKPATFPARFYAQLIIENLK